ncbi:MAG TPA: hypothetical protein VN719_00690 [Gemmatimonadales bacterium]|nr:hypothetical protein [Gemmatimonadales bacterium]
MSRPAEPACCSGYRLPTHPGAPEERVHCNGCAEAASLREQLATESASADSEHANLVRVSDKYRAGEDDRADLRSRLSAVEGERDEIKGALEGAREALRSSVATENAAGARVSELRGLLNRWRAWFFKGYPPPPTVDTDEALASHPLKTEGDGPTGGTRP